MALNFRKIFEGLRLVPKATSTVSQAGEMDVTTDGKIHSHNGTTSSVLITADHAATLTNKTIDGDDNTVQDLALGSLKTVLADAGKVLQRDAAGVVVTGPAIPSGGGDIVTTTGTQTLTNKTIDGSLNTLTVKDANVAVNELTRTKLKTGSASVVVVNDAGGALNESPITTTELSRLAGITGNIQTQIDAKASTTALTAHTGASTGVHGVTGAVVGTTDTQTLSNKTLVAPVIDDAVTLIQETTLATPTAGNTVLGVKTDGRLYTKNSLGLESLVGTGAGAINYIANGDAQGGTTGWSSYNDRLTVASVNTATDFILVTGAPIIPSGTPVNFQSTGSIGGLSPGSTYYVINSSAGQFQLTASIGGPVIDITAAATGTNVLAPRIPIDGTGGTPTIAALTTQSTTKIRGTLAFAAVKGANVTDLGQGWSYDFTIDDADKGKTVQTALTALMTGTLLADGNFVVYIYDKDNSQLLYSSTQAVSYSMLIGDFLATTAMTFNASNYRLCVHVASLENVVQTLVFDSVSVGPQIKSIGAYAANLGALTTSGTWTTNTSYIGKYWRTAHGTLVGDVTVNTSGAPTNANLSINLPPGLTIDTAALSSGVTDKSPVGIAHFLDAGSAAYVGRADVANSTSLRISTIGAGGTFANINSANLTQPFTWGGGDSATIRYEVPILGWSSGMALSSEVSGRPVGEMYSGNAGTASTASVTNIPFINVEKTSGNWNGSQYTAMSSETVYFDGCVYFSTSFSTNIECYVNGVLKKRVSDQVNAQVHKFGSSVNLRAGDVLTFRADVSGTLVNSVPYHYINISNQPSGSQQIAATEMILASYNTASGQTLTSGTDTTIIYGNKVEDTHGAFNPASGIFTVPANGRYRVTASVMFNNNLSWPANSFVNMSVAGGFYVPLDRRSLPVITEYIFCGGTSVTPILVAGTQLQIKVTQTRGGNTSLLADQSFNKIIIERLN